MRTLRIIEHISLDGVIQAPGGLEEDKDHGFEHGGWVVPHADPTVAEAVGAAHGGACDFLLGRRTYDIWSSYWPKVPKNPMSDSLNAATKYVATHRPESLEWGPVEALGDDIVAGVRRIKQTEGPNIILWGSASVAPVLIEHGLADEVLLLVYPVLIGRGRRFFDGERRPRELALIDTKTSRSGVVMSTYRPAGPMRTGSFSSPPR